MILRIDGKWDYGISSMIDKINEIIEQLNAQEAVRDETIATLQSDAVIREEAIATLQADAVAKDEVIAKLSAELTATRADAGLAEKEPVVAIPIKEEPIEPVIEEPIP